MLDQRKHTGVVVDIGHGRTTVAAFYAGTCGDLGVYAGISFFHSRVL